jgi:phospholipid/cholesterol/gamma-HCH transport system permease protein
MIDDPQNETAIEVKVPAGDHSADGSSTLRISIKGSLNVHTLSGAWVKTFDALRKSQSRNVVINGADLNYCDGAGLGLLAEVRREVAGRGGKMQIENLRSDLRSLVDISTLADPSAPQLTRPPRVDVFTETGNWTHLLIGETVATISLLGELCSAAGWALFHPRQFRLHETMAVLDQVGTKAVPVICLLGFLIGTILAFQTAPPLGRYGLVDMIPTMVCMSVVRELGPLLATLLLAGRTASAFAAELGTMKVTDEISALRSMGIDPVRYLVLPRVLAVMAAAPLLAIFSTFMGVIGGYSVMANYGFTFAHYVAQVRDAVTYKDLVGGEAKTVVFGLIVGGIGCLRGFRTGNGPGAVGNSATRAVVTSIVLIIVADGVFGVAYYYLKL